MIMEHPAFPGQRSVVPDAAVKFQKAKGWTEVHESTADERERIVTTQAETKF